MVNKPKAQGTRYESWLVDTFNDCYLLAERLAEGGMHDRGDVEVQGVRTFIVEAKARERLNVHQTLAHAEGKAAPDDAVVIWRKLTKTTPGAKRRTPDGKRDVVIMDLEVFIDLLGGDVAYPKSTEPRSD